MNLIADHASRAPARPRQRSAAGEAAYTRRATQGDREGIQRRGPHVVGGEDRRGAGESRRAGFQSRAAIPRTGREIPERPGRLRRADRGRQPGDVDREQHAAPGVRQGQPRSEGRRDPDSRSRQERQVQHGHLAGAIRLQQGERDDPPRRACEEPAQGRSIARRPAPRPVPLLVAPTGSNSSRRSRRCSRATKDSSARTTSMRCSVATAPTS